MANQFNDMTGIIIIPADAYLGFSDTPATETSVVKVYSGAGAPTSADANGSIYLRTDAGDADESLYTRVAGSWEPFKGV